MLWSMRRPLLSLFIDWTPSYPLSLNTAMWMRSMLGDIICQTFQRQVGKNQVPLFSAPEPGHMPKAMRIEFRLPTNYDKEEGYRHVELLLYAPGNYVAVVSREHWTVIPREALDYDEENEEEFIKQGYDYEEGYGEWRRWSYHDSCWRTDGVDRFLHEYENRLQGLNGLGEWYQTVELSSEQVEEIMGVVRAR